MVRAIIRKTFYVLKNIFINVFRRKVKVSLSCQIAKGSSLKKNVRIGKKTYFNGLIDQYSYIGDSCDIFASIGKYSSIGSNVKVVAATHPLHFISSSPFFYSAKKMFGNNKRDDNREIVFSESRQVSTDGIHFFGSIIGNDVWIGDNVLIKGSVVIGHGAVIGMGSVVTKDVEPYSIVAGNPAKVIRYRFDKETIDFLLRTEWWQLDHKILMKNRMCFCDVEGFKRWIAEENNGRDD